MECFKLKQVEVTDPSNEFSITNALTTQHLKNLLEKHSLQFAFQDGQIEHLCSSPDEPRWVLNVKRGILSMLQNTMEDWNYEGVIQEVRVDF